MYEFWDEFWWGKITGPQLIISEVSDALLNNKMVILKVSSDLSYRDSMRSAIHMSFQERNDLRDVIIESVDFTDENPEKLSPGRFILERFATPQVCKGYRERSRHTIQEYITANKEILENRIVWVKGVSKADTKQWIDFCKGFSRRTACEGLFVLEIHNSVPIPENSSLRYIDIAASVSRSDVLLFNTFLLEMEYRKSYSGIWRKYIAACAATLCDKDAEISQLLIETTDFKQDDPIDRIRQIADEAV